MRDKNYIAIAKIIAYIEKIFTYTSGVDKITFLSNTQLLEACVFNVLQIGELANRLSEDFRSQHVDIPWSKIRGIRNRLVHDYEGVNIELVWDIIKNDLDVLRDQLLSIRKH